MKWTLVYVVLNDVGRVSISSECQNRLGVSDGDRVAPKEMAMTLCDP